MRKLDDGGEKQREENREGKKVMIISEENFKNYAEIPA